MIQTTIPESAGWWLQRLGGKLEAQASRCKMLAAYYDNQAAIPAPATKAVRLAYMRLMSMARMNFAQLIVEAVQERQQVIAIRTGADGSEQGDKAAWRIWQANHLDADSNIAHRLIRALGVGYVMVGGINDRTGAPLITVEDPRCVVTEQDPIDRRVSIAGLKLYRDPVHGRWEAWLFLPGVVARAVGPTDNAVGGKQETMPTDFSKWDWQGLPVYYPPNAAGVVPIVQFVNPGGLGGCPAGEYEYHLSVLDRIQYTILNRLEIATLQAFKQRAVKGVPDKDAKGQPINYDDIFSADPGAVWTLPATAEMWESGAVDLGPIRSAVRDDIQDLAAVTRTPLYYLTPEAGANGSAEGAALAREGLVFKTGDRNVHDGESWEQVMALAFLVLGDEQRANVVDMEIVWTDPQRYSMAERYDAAAKAVAAGVPWRQVMSQVLGFSPQEIARMESERAADAVLLAAVGPTPAQAGLEAAPTPAAPGGKQPMTIADVKAAADAMGVLIRSGASAESAAEQVGLSGLQFTGAVPTTLRLPTAEADDLEQVGGG